MGVWEDRRGDLEKAVNQIRMRAGRPAFYVEDNKPGGERGLPLRRAAQVLAWQLASGINDAARSPLERAQDATFTGDRAVSFYEAQLHDPLDALPAWEEDSHIKDMICDPNFNEIGAGISGSPTGLFVVVFLGHRDQAPYHGDVEMAPLPIGLAEDLSIYGPDFGRGKLQF